MSQTDKGSVLAIRAFDQPTVQTVAATLGLTSAGRLGGGFPFWSPDSRFIAFFASGKLKKVSLGGAPPQILCDAVDGHGGTWNREGVIVFAADASGPLFQIREGGGVPTQVTELDATSSETAHRHPAFLPDGNHFLYLATSSKPENTAIVVGALNTKEHRRLVATSAKPGFALPNHLLFIRDTTLMAQRFNLKRLDLEGDPFPVAEDVGVNTVNSIAGFTTSDNGVVAWRSGGQVGSETHLAWVDRSGKPSGAPGDAAAYRNPALSPDLRHIAVHKVDGSNGDLWIIDVSRGTTTRFTLDAHKANYPIWSPDGTRIVFAAEGDSGRFNLHQKNAGGAGAEELLLKSDHVQVPEDWSADGHFILFRDLDPKNGPDLWALPMTGDRKPEPYLQSPFVEGQARFSPNGRWVAYTSNESGRNEVFIQSFPASARKYPVSSNGGVQPRWRGDGKELYFLAGIVSPNVATVTAVDVIESKDTLAIGAERPLFETTVQSKVRERNTWEVTPDGQRFLINRSDQADSVLTRPITVVVNWKPGVARR